MFSGYCSLLSYKLTHYQISSETFSCYSFFCISILFFFLLGGGVNLSILLTSFNLSLTLYEQYAWNNRIYCYGYDLITTSEGSTLIHHCTNSETLIKWRSLKYNRASKSRLNVKVSISYMLLFFKHNGLFSIVKFNISLFNFRKICVIPGKSYG